MNKILKKLIKFLLRTFFILTLCIFSVLADVSKNSMLSEIYKNVRFLICQGQSIEDSNSDFAINLRMVIKDKVEDGLGKKEIYKFLEEKYGDWILFKPPFKLKSILLWLFPYTIFIFVGFYLFFLIKKNKIQ